MSNPTEPRAPAPDASEVDYRRYLREHQLWTAERAASRPRAVPGTGTPEPPPEEGDVVVPLDAVMRTGDIETWWLPDPVRAWVEACHLSLGVPRVLATAAALCTAASVVQGNVEVEIKPGWREPLSLYWIMFSPTGSRKSALLKRAAAPVRALQAKRKLELEPLQRTARYRRKMLEAKIKSVISKAPAESAQSGSYENPFAGGYKPQAAERNILLDNLTKELDETPIPLAPEWLFDDINPTVVPRKLKHNLEAEGIARLAVLDAEGTFLANALGRWSGAVNVDILLKGYNGEPVDMVRTVSGSAETNDVHLPAAHISMLLLIQHIYLDAMREKPELGSNGFLGRCLVSHLTASEEPASYDAPSVPQDVQGGYERWIAALASQKPGTVYVMPAELQPTLRAMHNKLEADRLEGKGGVGYGVRTLGRLCRIYAMTQLIGDCAGNRAIANCTYPKPGAISYVKGIRSLEYLYISFYSKELTSVRAMEPATSPSTDLAHRCVQFLKRSLHEGTLKKGQLVSRAYIRRALHIDRNCSEKLCEELEGNGFLEAVCKRTKAGSGRASVRYRIVATAAPAELKLEAVPDLEPDIDELDPEDTELESEEP